MITTCEGRQIFLFFFIVAWCFACTQPDRDLFQRGNEALERGQFDVANSLFSRLLREYPASPYTEETLYFLATIAHSYVKDPEQAIEYYTQLMYLYPSSSLACGSRMKLADIYYETFHEYERAIEEYQKVIIHCNNPEADAEAQKKIGDCSYITGNYNQAIIEYQIVDRNYPSSKEHSRVLKRIADCYFIQGNMESAEFFYRKFLKLYSKNPDNREVIITLGQVLINQGQYCLAADMLRELGDNVNIRKDITMVLEKATKLCQESMAPPLNATK